MTPTRTGPPLLTLTRHPQTYGVSPVAGWDTDGTDWFGIDATNAETICVRCGGRIEYGYAPLVDGETRAHCVKCVTFVDALTGAGLE